METGTPLTELDVITSASDDDLLYIVDNPTGTASSKAIRVDNFLKFVGARYTTNAGQIIPSATGTIINFEDFVYDTNSAVTTGTAWKFTAPITGYYLIDCALLSASTTDWAIGEIANIGLYKNGVLYSVMSWFTSQLSANGIRFSVSGSDVIYLIATEYINIRISHTVGTNLALHNDGAYCFVSISKLY